MMPADNGTTGQQVENLRTDLDHEQKQSIFRAKLGIGIRVALILFAFGYMTWLMGAVSKLDASELTRMASISLEERLPELREGLRDKAVEMAPDITDQATQAVLNIPALLRQSLENQIQVKLDELIDRLETDLDAVLTTVIDDQVTALQAEFGHTTQEAQLDALIVGVSDIFRQTMITALDELYDDYSAEVRSLNDRLDHLRKDEGLTESEKIDRQLIEAWMVLVQRHEITNLEALAVQLNVGS